MQVFLGSLREIELERVKEKLSSAIMETCLALTIFREEFNLSFVGMFTLLTFVKVGALLYCGRELYFVPRQAALWCPCCHAGMSAWLILCHLRPLLVLRLLVLLIVRASGQSLRSTDASAVMCVTVMFFCARLSCFVQVFHWLVQDRVDYIEVTPSVSRLAHTRIVSFLVVLLVRWWGREVGGVGGV